MGLGQKIRTEENTYFCLGLLYSFSIIHTQFSTLLRLECSGSDCLNDVDTVISLLYLAIMLEKQRAVYHYKVLSGCLRHKLPLILPITGFVAPFFQIQFILLY
jgi:hypothetical protein